LYLPVKPAVGANRCTPPSTTIFLAPKFDIAFCTLLSIVVLGLFNKIGYCLLLSVPPNMAPTFASAKEPSICVLAIYTFSDFPN